MRKFIYEELLGISEADITIIENYDYVAALWKDGQQVFGIEMEELDLKKKVKSL
jgi:hypothetical protein